MKKTARKKKETFVEKVTEDVVPSLEHQEEQVLKPSKKFFKKRKFQVIAFIALFLVIGFLVFLQVSNLKDASQNQAQLASEEVKTLVKELNDKMLIPANETPTIATVTDVTKLEGQAFFKNAKNGDKVVIFGSTKEAILYRPAIHKIIAVAPINSSDNPNPNGQQSGSASASTTPVPKKSKLVVAVLNSTPIIGLARKGAAFLDKQKYDIMTGNARQEYDRTTISVVKKDQGITDSQLQEISAVFPSVKPAIVELPPSEVPPADADVVIILGTDFAPAP